MSKYDPLYRRLGREQGNRLVFSRAQLDELIPEKLPPTAWNKKEWWANEDPDHTRHVQSRAWTLAGWTATPDLDAGVVTFTRSIKVKQ